MRPKVLVKGGDYRHDEVVGHALVEGDGGEVLLIDLVPGFSTTRIVHKSRAPSLAERLRWWVPSRRAGASRADEEFFGDVRSGFFVEVGANSHGRSPRPWHLEQLGWTGVLVEPQPDLAADLWCVRSAKVFAICLLVAAKRRPPYASLPRRAALVARP